MCCMGEAKSLGTREQGLDINGAGKQKADLEVGFSIWR